jgi:hypothetical protein
MHRTSIDETAITMEGVGSIDGLTYCESIDLRSESIYLHLQINVFVNLLDASFLGDTGKSIPTTQKIPLLQVVG